MKPAVDRPIGKETILTIVEAPVLDNHCLTQIHIRGGEQRDAMLLRFASSLAGSNSIAID
jgi:hypothetical protein